jgi:lysophospholipase L1-like esterase
MAGTARDAAGVGAAPKPGAWRRRLLAVFAGLLVLLAVGHSAFAAADPWRAEIDVLVAHDRDRPPPKHAVVFVGSSSIRLWTSLATDFPGVPVINRGFGGSMIADSTRNAGRIVVAYQPKLVVLYAGDNDVDGGRSAAQVVADFRAFVRRIRHDLPQAAIAFISIKPSVARWHLWPVMREANAGIEKWASAQRDVVYVDAAAKMLDADGRPRPELLLEDGLHMRPAGYAIWIDVLKPVLARYGFVAR